jgi:murein DD-endopeptidase MepM/ murein hydrolase activator NlpD
MKTLLIFAAGVLVAAAGLSYLLPLGEVAVAAETHAAALAPASAPASPPAQQTMSVPDSTPPITPPPTIEQAIEAPVAPLLAHPGGLAVPVRGITASQLVDTFNDQRGSDRFHQGIDIIAPTGTPVVAVDEGPVVKLFNSERGGLTVYQFDKRGNFAYYYAHLDAYAENLAQDQYLKRGDVVGYVGVSGNADPLTPHLHFEVMVLGPEKQWWKSTSINPYTLFER